MEVYDTMAHEQLTYLGHSAFLITMPPGDILIDPFLSGNPLTSIGTDDVHPTYTLLTHGHSDHLGNTITGRTGQQSSVRRSLSPALPETLQTYIPCTSAEITRFHLVNSS